MKNLLFLLALISMQLNAQTSTLDRYREDQRREEAQKELMNEIVSSIEMFVLDDVTVDPSEMYAPYRDDRPKVGEVFKVYMGDTMMLQRSGQFADCLIPRFSLDKKVPYWRYVIKADKPICKSKASDKHYKPDYPNSLKNNGVNEIMPVSIKKDKKKSTYKVCLRSFGMNASCKKDLTEDQFDLGPAFIQFENALQRNIEYSGKSGNIVKFIYSEFENKLARDAFTREFSIDLTEGNVAAYKGAVFEVIKATNAEITYKMIRHFPK